MICAWIETSRAETGSSAMISFGSQRERAGDADALALAAGELVREAVVVLGGEADAIEQLLDLRAQLACPRQRRAAGAARRRSGRRACAGSATRTGPGRSSASRAAAGAARVGRCRRSPARRSGPSRRSASSSCRIVRASVDLPQPDSPTRPSVSPLATESETPSTAWTAPTWRSNRTPDLIGKCLTRSVTSSRARRSPFASVRRPRGRCRRRPRCATRFAFAPGRASSGRACSPSPPRDSSGGVLRCTCRTRAGSAAGICSPRAASSSDGGWPLICASRARPRPVEAHDRAQQAPGVGMLRVVEDLLERPRLDDLARRTSRAPGRRCRRRRPGRG